MANCVTCGDELHPERAEKYDYCTKPACQEQNLKGVTIVSVAVNKAADHYQVVDDRTKGKLASGSYVQEMATGPGKGRGQAATGNDGGRTVTGTPAAARERRPAGRESGLAGRGSGLAGRGSGLAGRGSARAGAAAKPAGSRGAQPAARKAPAPARGERSATRPRPQRRAWSDSQEKLALIYNEQGIRPDEIARRLGLSRSVVVQMLLAARGRARP
jgi:hypothetical protein